MWTIIESPFKGQGDNPEAIIEDRKKKMDYARECCRDSYTRGEHPFASHLFYPQFMNDNDPTERQAGINFGYDHWKDARSVVFYVDLGLSDGMIAALRRAIDKKLAIEFRRLSDATDR